MISEKLLCYAAAEADKALLAGLPEAELCDHIFSIGFERRMKRILRREAHPVRYRLLQSAACFILVVFLSASTVLLVSSEARAAFIGWVRDVYEAYFVYSYTGTETEFPDGVVYCPGWLPNGYHEAVAPEPDGQAVIVYENEEGAFIVFTCSFNIESSAVYVEREYADVLKVFVDEIPADLYKDREDDNADVLVWIDEVRGVIFSISGHLTQEEFIRMAASVQAVQAVKQNQSSNQDR